MKFFVGLLALVGVAVAAPNLGIIGGNDAEAGEYPFVAAIELCLVLDFDCEYKCAAVILSENWILTAGLCASTSSQRRILAGAVSLVGNNEERQLVHIDKYVIHPDFQGDVGPNDIALIKLSTPLTFNDLVQPANLPVQGVEPSGDAVVLGWGYQGGINAYPNNLKEAHVSILSPPDCQSALKKVLDEEDQDIYNTTSNICAGPLTGTNVTCNLDTGGALVQNGQVVGLVSWTLTPCGENGEPSVFTKISNFVNWINEHTV